jgi:hypothetical protein
LLGGDLLISTLLFASMSNETRWEAWVIFVGFGSAIFVVVTDLDRLASVVA